MKSLSTSFLLGCFLLLCLSSVAQPSTTVPDKKYGEGGTLTTTTETSSDGIVTVTEEYRNTFPKLKEITRRIKNRAGQDSIVITIIYDEFGQGELKDSTIEKRYNSSGDMIYLEAVRHDAPGTGIDSGTRSEKQPDGDWTEYEYDPRTKQFVRVRSGRPKKVKENGVTGYLASCDTARIELSAGYSLSISGIQVSIANYVKPRFALVLDASHHSRKGPELTTINNFILVGLQYDLNRKVQLPFRPRIRFMGGKFSEIYKTTDWRSQKDHTAFGIGLHLNYRVSKRIMAGVFPDYFMLRYKGEWTEKIRLGIGCTIRTGCL